MAVGLLIDVLCKISAADRYVRKWVPSKPWNLTLGSKVLTILLLYVHVLLHSDDQFFGKWSCNIIAVYIMVYVYHSNVSVVLFLFG